MTLTEFKESIKASKPPEKVGTLLTALWHDAKGNWEAAHNLAQDVHNIDGSWIHAYLHRKEGDAGNASYWYHRANQPISTKSLQEEWEDIARALLR